MTLRIDPSCLAKLSDHVILYLFFSCCTYHVLSQRHRCWDHHNPQHIPVGRRVRFHCVVSTWHHSDARSNPSPSVTYLCPLKYSWDEDHIMIDLWNYLLVDFVKSSGMKFGAHGKQTTPSSGLWTWSKSNLFGQLNDAITVIQCISQPMWSSRWRLEFIVTFKFQSDKSYSLSGCRVFLEKCSTWEQTEDYIIHLYRYITRSLYTCVQPSGKCSDIRSTD